jgi:hypothetical protein
MFSFDRSCSDFWCTPCTVSVVYQHPRKDHTVYRLFSVTAAFCGENNMIILCSLTLLPKFISYMLAELVTFSLYLDTENIVPTGRNIFHVLCILDTNLLDTTVCHFYQLLFNIHCLCNITCYKKILNSN